MAQNVNTEPSIEFVAIANKFTEKGIDIINNISITNSNLDRKIKVNDNRIIKRKNNNNKFDLVRAIGIIGKDGKKKFKIISKVSEDKKAKLSQLLAEKEQKVGQNR